MSTVRIPAKQRFVLDGATWGDYTHLLKALDERRHVRVTYDRGILEVVTLTYEHGRSAYILGLLISLWGAGRGVAIRAGGTTTFRRRDKDRGLEPDNCYWIAREARVRGLTRIDLRRDPPPDLVVEIDVTHSSVPRMPIYASLGVPEVWRLRRTDLSFHLLQPDESYAVAPVSKALPPLTPAHLTPYLTMSNQQDDSEIIRKFSAWVRKLSPPAP
jgi:Uma2 family endonuclease